MAGSLRTVSLMCGAASASASWLSADVLHRPLRKLAHNFAHVSPPSMPPSPPAPPLPPPAFPPPPPLPFVFPALPAAILVIMTMCCCCLGSVIVAKRKKKKGGDDGKDDDAGKADDKGGEDGEAGPENAAPATKSFRSRGCTDILCLLLFIAFWMGMMYLLYLGCTVGDPYSVAYGKDYLGNRCGRGNFTDRPKAIFPRIDQDVMEQQAIATTKPWRLEFYQLCVAHCPNITVPHRTASQPPLWPFAARAL